MGLHGALQLGSRRVFAFGNVTGVGAGSRGQDPWRSDARFEVELEKAYGGLPGGPGREGHGAQRVLRPPDLAAQQGLPLLAVRGELQRGAVGRVVHRRAHGPRAGVPGQAPLVEGLARGVPRRPPGVLPQRQRHAVPGPEPAVQGRRPAGAGCRLLHGAAIQLDLRPSRRIAGAARGTAHGQPAARHPPPGWRRRPAARKRARPPDERELRHVRRRLVRLARVRGHRPALASEPDLPLRLLRGGRPVDARLSRGSTRPSPAAPTPGSRATSSRRRS